MNILISACLLGLPCRYDGTGKGWEGATALIAAGHHLVPVCPEQLGGLPTPRPPAERVGEKVRTKAGADVTEPYRRGVEGAVDLARLLDCPCAVLKARSPSCGSGTIYDGTFTGTRVPGDGVAAAALKAAGVAVFTEEGGEALGAFLRGGHWKAIVAADQAWGIGKDGNQPCYIPADLKRFKALTSGHAVILGRKTLATFPGGRPLPGRRNLILSRDPGFAPEGAEVFRDVETLRAAAPEDAFVIGGGAVYQQLLPWCDTVYVTRLERTFPADTYFPNLDNHPDWRLAGTEGPYDHQGLTFHYDTYRRIWNP